MRALVYGIILFLISLVVTPSYALNNRSLPASILAESISDSIIYDADFDYEKIGRFTNLRIFSESYHAKKNLVDHVVVNKQHHQMFLMNNNKVIKSYWIALSDRPVGAKQFEGDRRTPEGTYTLDYIKERSNYYKAFHISYPNTKDIENARKFGARPGGMIMIHGQPPSGGEYQETVQRTDWTNGCIAMLNPDLDEFLTLVDVGTPITINP